MVLLQLMVCGLLIVLLTPEEGEKYRIRFLDFVHGFLSMLVFGAVALFDQNVVKCLIISNANGRRKGATRDIASCCSL